MRTPAYNADSGALACLQIQTLWEGPGVCISIILPEDPVRGHRLGSVLPMGSILDGCQS